MGYANCVVPGVIQRNVLESPGWYTAYTPYQPEIAQGRLEALLNFQTVVADLTGLPIANASLLDEATAAAEAMTMAHGAVKHEGNRFLVDRGCHPQTIAVVQTRGEARGIEVEVGDAESFAFDGTVFGCLIQYPGTEGQVVDYRALTERAHAGGALVTAATDLLALTLLEGPGAWGADIAVGNSQRFGVPLGYGGPHAAFFATMDEYKRQVPGRLIGVSRDRDGRPALRMALQTREQHIRREKATSNICTAQVLLAVVAGMYAVYHGPEGLLAIAETVHRRARALARAARGLGFTVPHSSFFDTVALESTPETIAALHRAARAKRINLRALSDRRVAIALDETVSSQDLADLVACLAAAAGAAAPSVEDAGEAVLPAALRRSSACCAHPVFHRYRSETEMLRYLKELESRDLSLTAAMIPLGSCTMKLNATAEMVGISWRGFNGLHPFAPVEQTPGYAKLFEELETWLAEITGFAGISLQPNAGSQGEFAGLLVIRAYHRARGDTDRDVCLIPQSAHGTNPASAVMAGFRVVVVKTDAEGNIDLADLTQKATEHRDRLGALMVTYPSTHGVFEDGIRQVCNVIHANGGQVYMDGANMNAQVGLCRPADIGADVCHLNLHKTFCIPHGGGGPGMGPIGVAAHLAPHLPTHPVIPVGGPESCGTISAAPWGSPSILPISWAYIRMMGPDGLTEATRVAILAANYVAKRLDGHYPILYTGNEGLIAHECIVDCRGFKQTAGVEVEDVAKRLIDYGFHPPTVSFPVAGIADDRAHRERVAGGARSLLRRADRDPRGDQGDRARPGRPRRQRAHHAPHTLAQVAADDWKRPYSRTVAGFPSEAVRSRKSWPTVGRIGGAFGDRNLVCTCPPIEAYAGG
ncbi:MAG: aminomethyl-transferring glycine dehydrogenase [Gemmatimonadales bacterium]